MRKLNFFLPAVLALAAGCNGNDLSKALYKDPSADVEKRVEDLLGRMTLEEKIWQLNQGHLGRNDNPNNVAKNFEEVPYMVGSMIGYFDDSRTANAFQHYAMDSTRLGIPVIFGYDAIHGFETGFPIPLAQAASFNPELAGKANRITAMEAYAGGINWTFSPMVDIARDPRWGRVMEGYGEDPYLASVFAASTVKAYQGDDPSQPGYIAACLKHYVGYGASEAGRDYHAVDLSRQLLWDTYLQPFKAGVEAGAMTLMSSFNTLSGVPASANPYTLTEVRKNLWGHRGFVVSDWGAVEQTILQGVAADRAEACEISFNAGVEMDMCDYVYSEKMAEVIKQGRIKMKDVDEAVRRVLRVKFELGLFDNPYRAETTVDDYCRPEYFAVAEELAQETMVLLKNDGILPLKKDARIALVGPIADDKVAVLGNWRSHATPERTISILDGMKVEFSNVRYSPGCSVNADASIEDTDRSGFAAAANAARGSDIIVLCLGEGDKWSGENKTRASISLPQIQEDLFETMCNTGKPVVVIVEAGRPIDLTRIAPKAAAIVDIWCPGHRGGPALAGILSGRYNPSAKLPITFPAGLGQVPIYYNHRDRARRGKNGEYIDGTPLEPLYDFGHGLSYSTFEYGDIALDGLTARVSVTNTSDRDGKETVLWFIKDPACSIARPVKELKHFEKRLIKAGETEEFIFEIDKMKDLGFVDAEGRQFFEPGEFVLMAGNRQLMFTF